MHHEKEVFLTFDDGPHPQITPWVMAELDKVGAKATFFVVGENAEKYFSIVDEMQTNKLAGAKRPQIQVNPSSATGQ